MRILAKGLVAFFLLSSSVLTAAESVTYDYNQLFDYARQLLTRKEVRAFLKVVLAEELSGDAAAAKKVAKDVGKTAIQVKDISEAQVMILLQQNPEVFKDVDKYLKEVPAQLKDTEKEAEIRKKWRAYFKELLHDPEHMKEFKRLNNPLEPMLLQTKDGKPGYSNLKIYFTHERIKDGKTLPADNLKQEWIDFIKKTQHQYVSNVFDFDLTEVADALIDAAKRGVDVTQGIDKGVAEARPEVMEVYKKLKAGGVKVHLVDSVGLNHQKTAARDWDHPGKGGALFSSGNLTQSCIGPEGDLVKFPPPRSKYSVTNANHMITMDSDIFASLINHELTKTLREPYQLRGSEYPLTGAYKVMGTPYAGMKAAKDPYIVVTFTPGGGLGDVGNNVISRIIRDTEGPIHMMQFAFSSADVENALLERAKAEVAKKGGKFEFHSVGDGPFAMQYWSRFLDMSGFELKKDGDKKTYAEVADSPWRKVLGKDGFATLQDNIRMPPEVYGNHSVKVGEESIDVSSKIHHKVIISGRVANAGTSFNYSAAAQHNQEQFVVVADQGIADEMRGAADWLIKNSKSSVAAEALRRNKAGDFDPDVGPDEVHGSTKKNSPKLVKAPGTAGPACEKGFEGVVMTGAGKK